jgi:hypothetical protein
MEYFQNVRIFNEKDVFIWHTGGRIPLEVA